MVKIKQRLAVEPIERFARPFQEFARLEVSAGLLLIFCTVAALAWANSPWRDIYEQFWHTGFTIGIADKHWSHSLHWWINDGLMAIFFFVVGLEIKREILVGELATLRQAVLPIAGALGGMVFPAAIYLLWNFGRPSAAGWGIPMATDIAFALGVLALLGDRVPFSLKIFLTALAIIDDIGAVLVIAIFYTAEISWMSLGVGAVFMAALLAASLARARHPLIYAVLGLGLWICFIQSGVHATVAGVLLALTVPARQRMDVREFVERSEMHLRELTDAAKHGASILSSEEQQSAVKTLQIDSEHVETPLQRFEGALHPWVTFFIMPIFALANAGVPLEGELGHAFRDAVPLGIITGLVIGKPAGIFLFSWLAVRFRLATLSSTIRWRQVFGAGLLGGLGFTMSLFIAGLAFGPGELLDLSKIGILTASLGAGIAGWLFLRQCGRRDGARLDATGA